MRFRLDLSLSLETATEYQAATECRARMNPQQWTLLAQFAAEVLAIHEADSSGQKVVVAPARALDSPEVLEGLRLKPAGRD